MDKIISVQRLDTLRSELEGKRALGIHWRTIARDYPGVPAGTLCAIAKGREPHKASIRAALGLAILGQAEVCPVHGKVCAIKHRAGIHLRPRIQWKRIALFLWAAHLAKLSQPIDTARAVRERR